MKRFTRLLITALAIVTVIIVVAAHGGNEVWLPISIAAFAAGG